MQDAGQAPKLRLIILLLQWGGFILFCLLVWHFTLQGVLHYQQNKNAHLLHILLLKKQEISAWEAREQDVSALESRLHFITGLYQKNNQAAEVLGQINRAIPKTIVVNQIKRVRETIMLEGEAESDLDIIHLMENIAHTSLFKQPVITAISAREQHRYFQLNIGIK
ncbi:MAG: hypothetical protein ACD_60C00057G0035 [uncultured bacterium]|nr:MAG: hypothetical protein ACD_60C00057G0035 [uncultured bacterium]